MPARSSDVPGKGPLRLSAAARALGYDRRTLLKYAHLLRIFRVGREYRVPREAIADVMAGALVLDRRRPSLGDVAPSTCSTNPAQDLGDPL